MTNTDTPKSGLKGANWNGARRKWFAQISVNGIKCYLGMFENAAAAHLAYTAAAADKADGTFWAKYTPRSKAGSLAAPRGGAVEAVR